LFFLFSGNAVELTGQWPDDILNRTTTALVSADALTEGSLPQVDDSISYVPIQIAILKKLPIIGFFNKAGYPIMPNEISRMEAVFENDASLL
jgi:hypothetical protein